MGVLKLDSIPMYTRSYNMTGTEPTAWTAAAIGKDAAAKRCTHDHQRDFPGPIRAPA
jgi:hypothetical protein